MLFWQIGWSKITKKQKRHKETVWGRGKLNLKFCAVLMKACITEKKRRLDDLNLLPFGQIVFGAI